MLFTLRIDEKNLRHCQTLYIDTVQISRLCLCLHTHVCPRRDQNKEKNWFSFSKSTIIRNVPSFIRDYSYYLFWNRRKHVLRQNSLLFFSPQSDKHTQNKSHVKHKNDNFIHFKWQVHLDLILHEA